LFVASYAVISNLFTSTTVFLLNYSSGNIKTNSIQPVSVCLAFFEAIWHFFASGLAFIVHLDLATLVTVPSLYLPNADVLRHVRVVIFFTLLTNTSHHKINTQTNNSTVFVTRLEQVRSHDSALTGLEKFLHDSDPKGL